ASSSAGGVAATRLGVAIAIGVVVAGGVDRGAACADDEDDDDDSALRSSTGAASVWVRLSAAITSRNARRHGSTGAGAGALGRARRGSMRCTGAAGSGMRGATAVVAGGATAASVAAAGAAALAPGAVS